MRFRVAGSAQPGVDFQDLGAAATIPAHQGSVVVAVRPLGQGASARASSVTLTLEPEAAYLPDSPQTATVSLLGANGPLSSVPAPSGLVAWWPGENNANDIVGGNNGALFNGAGYAPGEVGQAFAVNGANAGKCPSGCFVDTDGNGLPDGWELKYFGQIGVNPNGNYDRK